METVTAEELARFAAEVVLKPEGELSDDPNDPGGVTHWGISLRFALGVGDSDRDGRPDLDLDGDGDVDREDILMLPRERAIELVVAHFWKPLRCDELPDLVAVAVCDAGFNQGRGPAVMDLQAALRVTRDGRLGPETRRAANEADPRELFLDVLSWRGVRYAGTRNFDRYGRGWLRRLHLLQDTCAAAA